MKPFIAGKNRRSAARGDRARSFSRAATSAVSTAKTARSVHLASARGLCLTCWPIDFLRWPIVASTTSIWSRPATLRRRSRTPSRSQKGAVSRCPLSTTRMPMNASRRFRCSMGWSTSICPISSTSTTTLLGVIPRRAATSKRCAKRCSKWRGRPERRYLTAMASCGGG